jgi:hypothetical protein
MTNNGDIGPRHDDYEELSPVRQRRRHGKRGWPSLNLLTESRPLPPSGTPRCTPRRHHRPQLLILSGTVTLIDLMATAAPRVHVAA